MNEGITEAEWGAATAAIHSAVAADASILLVCHVNPDGDALGSMLGVAHALVALGSTRLQATFPGPLTIPEPFAPMPGLHLLVPEDQAIERPDLLITFDAASESRLGMLRDRLETAVDTVVLDHHASFTGFGRHRLVAPTSAATAVIAAELIDRLGVALDRSIAECLYIGVITDTGSFRYELTTPAVHRLAARLVETGINPGEVSQRIFDSRTFGAVKLYGEVLSRAVLEVEKRLVWTTATLDDLKRHDQPVHVLEGLIDGIRSTVEADVACLLKQVAPEEWSVSLRGRGGVDVSRVAIALGGGGHRLAAGFTGLGSADEVLDRIRAEL